MRTNLIMHFHCTECGGVLNVEYREKDGVKLETYSGSFDHDPEPTGAACMYVPAVMVEPCRKCIEKHAGPARELSAALKKLVAVD